MPLYRKAFAAFIQDFNPIADRNLARDARRSIPAEQHALRARIDAILVGRGTLEADNPRLDVRLPGIENRSPARWLLSHSAPPQGCDAI